jgi:hypothetical protein
MGVRIQVTFAELLKLRPALGCAELQMTDTVPGLL